MLLDTDSPKSRAIFAAASRLDALNVIWHSASISSEGEIEKHIGDLRMIAKAHFAASHKIDGWLTELSRFLKLDYQKRMESKGAYWALIQNLDWDEGFQTGYI